jgi:uncharacterized protein (DUF1800 family)
LWHLVDHKNVMHAAERRRPRDEVVAATVLRAVHSRWQLREVMCGFWHDHFNVDALGSEAIGVALPAYDRDVIRRHCFGNFREMLEAAATSTAMQYYLSNRSSRSGAANENYARELFELHTMGRGAYLNDRYDRWRDVPGALKGKPAGYIDQDVYEAARARRARQVHRLRAAAGGELRHGLRIGKAAQNAGAAHQDGSRPACRHRGSWRVGHA